METKKVAKEYLQKDILRTIFQMWYSFYTTEIGKERKAAIEDCDVLVVVNDENIIFAHIYNPPSKFIII